MVLGLVGLGGILVWVMTEGPFPFPVPVAVKEEDNSPPALTSTLPNPALPGPYVVQTMTYGSGADLHRPEYGPQVNLRTDPVDGRAFVSGWNRLRTQFWGFDAREIPLNGRVWLPEGPGPFPLVLIVHGNHNMADFSDDGYTYLAELFASHGMITVSVDQNFLNGSAYANIIDLAGLERENDARAWLLLEHLRQWREWNQMEDSPLASRVDLDRVGLVGHSRGGEAVAIAAAFNRLSRYPDRATITFDYNFGIRAVAAIAPVDGQYRPAGLPTSLEDVHYLVLHGLNDGDVTSFQGSDQYQRVTFSAAESNFFKASVYIAGANHGQFNSSWGVFDRSPPDGFALNRAGLLEPADQRLIAQVFLNAFLRTALVGDVDYRLFFQEAGRGVNWLPDTPLRTQYTDAATRPVATFAEDIEVSTTTAPGGRISASGFNYWQEYRLGSKTDLYTNSVLTLGWQTASHGSPASYTIQLPAAGPVPALTDKLVVSIGDARDPAKATEPLDLTIRLQDGSGNQADLPLSHVSPVPLPLTAQLTRLSWMSDLPPGEVVLQTLSLPLIDFTVANPAFNPVDLTTISFRFDRSSTGRIVLDNIGFQPELALTPE
jgi:dienelactone hydrolase